LRTRASSRSVIVDLLTPVPVRVRYADVVDIRELPDLRWSAHLTP
jgi:hypothetical protein